MPTPEESALVRDLQDWPLELRQLKDRVQSHQDAAQTEKLRAEIEELTRYLDEVFEAAVGAKHKRRSR